MEPKFEGRLESKGDQNQRELRVEFNRNLDSKGKHTRKELRVEGSLDSKERTLKRSSESKGGQS